MPMQEQIYRKLADLVAPGPAEFYRDGAYLVEQARLGPQPLRTSTHLVHHLAREIEGGLRDVLELVMDWGAHPGGKRPKQVSHEDEIRAALRGLGISEGDEAGEAWLALRAYGLAKYAHRDSLALPRPLDAMTFRMWEQFELVLDVVLERFSARYGVVYQRLDSLLAISAPAATDITELTVFLPNSYNAARYFFGRLNSATWLKPLLEAGLFRYPPDVQRDEKEGSYQYPNWPQAWYLARVAGDDPDTVAETIAQAETNNPVIHDYFLDALLTMPIPVAAGLTPRAVGWAEGSYPPLDVRKQGLLIARLAAGGHGDEARSLARTVLALRSEERSLKQDGEAEGLELPPSPRGRFAAWDYQEIAEAVRGPLVESDPAGALRLFADLLSEAVRIMSRNAEEADGRLEDYSYIWRPQVESRGGHHDRIEAVLVHAVWDTAEQVIVRTAEIAVVVEGLESRRWMVFHRIALSLLGRHADVAMPLIQARLADPARFYDHGLRSEYDALLQRAFGALDRHAQDQILSWIESGLSAEFRESSQSWAGPISDDRWANEVDAWRRERLQPILEYLPPEWMERYGAGSAADDEPDDEPDGGPSWGPIGSHHRSPITVDEARAMRPDGLTLFARTWNPGEGREGTLEGLGHLIENLAIEEPAAFALAADSFGGAPLACARGLLSGLLSAANSGHAFSWGPVLSLCRQIVVSAVAAEPLSNDSPQNDPQVWTCRTVLDLLHHGISAKPGEIPADLRDQVWGVLEPLTHHWDPVAGASDASDRDLFNHANTSVRSHAAMLAIQYVGWVRRVLERQPGGVERLARGFNETPEAREVFDRHLDLQWERSEIVRAAYGAQFPWLIQIDAAWAASAVPKLFPAGEADRSLHSAAWRTYLRRTIGYDIALPLLREQYVQALEALGPGDGRDEGDSPRRLADHVLGFHFRGLIGSEDQLVTVLSTRAGPVLRGYVVENIARDLLRFTEAPSGAGLSRRQRLWETWFQQARLRPQEHRPELASFGWWVSVEWLPAAWMLRQLTEVLRLVGKSEAQHGIVERLAELATVYPGETAEAFHAFVTGFGPDSRLGGVVEDVRKILQSGLGAGDRTRKLTTETIHRLSAHGWPEFLNLLE
jgi:hypothetical protein